MEDLSSRSIRVLGLDVVVSSARETLDFMIGFASCSARCENYGYWKFWRDLEEELCWGQGCFYGERLYAGDGVAGGGVWGLRVVVDGWERATVSLYQDSIRGFDEFDTKMPFLSFIRSKKAAIII